VKGESYFNGGWLRVWRKSFFAERVRLARAWEVSWKRVLLTSLEAVVTLEEQRML